MEQLHKWSPQRRKLGLVFRAVVVLLGFRYARRALLGRIHAPRLSPGIRNRRANSRPHGSGHGLTAASCRRSRAAVAELHVLHRDGFNLAFWHLHSFSKFLEYLAGICIDSMLECDRARAASSLVHEGC